MELAKQVSRRHIKIVTLLRKQEALKATLEKMRDVKYFAF